MRVLVISDTHINDRASEVPELMLRLIASEAPYDAVVFAGDLTNEETLEWVRGLAPASYVVVGNMDYLDLPEHEVLRVGPIVIGVIHGHQVYPRGDAPKLYRLARMLGADLLISGHTHVPSIRLYHDKLLVNPGSLTGVASGSGAGGAPSFVVMDVLDNEVALRAYHQVQLGDADYLRRDYRFVLKGSTFRVKKILEGGGFHAPRPCCQGLTLKP